MKALVVAGIGSGAFYGTDKGEGYMRKPLEFVYKIADKKKAAGIPDTDVMGKCKRRIHLGMKLEQIRGAAGYKVCDLIRGAEYAVADLWSRDGAEYAVADLWSRGGGEYAVADL